MNNPVLEEIKAFAIQKLNAAYGYCGSAEGDDIATLNSDDKAGNNIKISIKSVPQILT